MEDRSKLQKELNLVHKKISQLEKDLEKKLKKEGVNYITNRISIELEKLKIRREQIYRLIV